jgi:signal transduction histidine kinase
MQAGLRMLAATVNNVLHFHQLPCPHRAPTDAGELLGWAKDFLEPMATQAGVRIELAHELQGVEILADRHRLEQVLLNLALNALRSLSGQGRLVLSGRLNPSTSPATVEIEVTDSGAGLPDEYVDHIFEPGFTTRPGSPGLGLAVCKLIVEQHGGTIRGRNLPSGGACFTLRFPREGAA